MYTTCPQSIQEWVGFLCQLAIVSYLPGDGSTLFKVGNTKQPTKGHKTKTNLEKSIYKYLHMLPSESKEKNNYKTTTINELEVPGTQLVLSLSV